jgi:tRNA dimethylallyltransferase
VNCDAMLVYRGMDVGVAKPSREQRARVPHHLLDIVDPREPFSVAEYQSRAREALADIAGRGREALLVGGSGLYFRAVVDELTFPGTDRAERRLLEAEAAALGPDALYRRLEEIDPQAAARIEPANSRRTVRALEVAAVTGRLFSSFARSWEVYRRAAVRVAGVHVARVVLHERIERRHRALFPALLEETRRLLERGFGPFLTAWQAIGYAEAVACLEGRLAQDEALAVTIRRTKALARRQMAWFRRDPRIRWFEAGAEGAVAVVDDIARYLRGGLAREGRRPSGSGRLQTVNAASGSEE